MDLGPHAAFIWSAYSVYALVLIVLIAWLVLDGRRHAAKLAELEARGVRRRAATPGPTYAKVRAP